MSVPCGGRFSTFFAKNRQIGRLLDSPTHTNEREFISLLPGVLFGNSEIPNKIPCLLHGFSLMDKQLLLTEMRLTRCRLMPYIVNALLAAFFQTRPCCPGVGALGMGARTHLDLFMCSVAQNDPKLSQIIKNTSIATVTGTMNFCCLPVTLFQPLIA